MKRFKNIILTGIGLLLLSACQTPPPLNFSVNNTQISQQKIDAELRSITVTLAQSGETRTPLTMGMESVPVLWQNALEDGLNRMAIFQDGSDTTTNVVVKVVDLDPPEMGITMITKAEAHYEVIDRRSGEVMFARTIKSEGVVPPGYAFLGVTRAVESINRAVNNNISNFMDELQLFASSSATN